MGNEGALRTARGSWFQMEREARTSRFVVWSHLQQSPRLLYMGAVWYDVRSYNSSRDTQNVSTAIYGLNIRSARKHAMEEENEIGRMSFISYLLLYMISAAEWLEKQMSNEYRKSCAQHHKRWRTKVKTVTLLYKEKDLKNDDNKNDVRNYRVYYRCNQLCGTLQHHQSHNVRYIRFLTEKDSQELLCWTDIFKCHLRDRELLNFTLVEQIYY